MAKDRILVVDDEEDLLELIRYNLSKEGYRVTCAASGEAITRTAKAAAVRRGSIGIVMVLVRFNCSLHSAF